MTEATRVVVLAGGFGGARMAHGFALLGPERVQLTVVGNTGDDLEIHGLHVSPDLDTVMYTLAGLANVETGWGVTDETWSSAEMLARYGQPTWFRLGDRDLATHVTRTARLRTGETLTSATSALASALGVQATLLPMTDQPVRTKIRTADGWLDFQDYFVRRRHTDEVLELRFDGVGSAQPTSEVTAALDSAGLVVIAPSNPFVSVAPILALAGVLDRLIACEAPVIAISPIVGGRALRGPAADMLRSLAGEEATSAGIAAHYSRSYPGLIDALVLDSADSADADAVGATGIGAVVTPTVIGEESERRRLAEELLEVARTIRV
jgi:LPPG:FO 2-phospho-L-lactate transferase